MKRLIVLWMAGAAAFAPIVPARAADELPRLHGSTHEDPEPIPWEEGVLPTGELGSHLNPVLCHQPSGEREYLDRLRCRNGASPAYERVGSFGSGPDGHIIDGYDVLCPDYRATVFMDMYHEGDYETAPVGMFRMGLSD